jgi:hypothetical protein
MTDIIRKAFTPHELKLDDAGSIELAFAQFNVIDADGDVTLPGAFPVKEVPMSAYGHTSWDGALPVGKGTISESGDWAIFKGRFFMDTTAGRETHATIKGLGPLAEYSYGYTVPKDGSSRGQFSGQDVRFLKTLDPHEISPVLKGAGIGTHTLAIKSGAPEPGAPTADLISWHSASRAALMDRLKTHFAARGGDGRELSRGDQAMKADLEEAWRADLEALLAMEPPPAMADAVTLDVLFSTAKRLGVPV